MYTRVLIIDDDLSTCNSLGQALIQDGYDVRVAMDGEGAVKVLKHEIVDVVVSDVRMGRVSGFDVLAYVNRHCPDTVVIMVTGYGTIESAVEAMKMGAYDYLTKPVDIDKLNLLIQKAMRSQKIMSENRRLRQQLKERFSLSHIVGRSRAIQQILRQVEQVAATDATVLIQGESGSGKELVAEAIHYNSPRSDRAIMKVNCAALAQGLVESELFGHERGAFTGAVKEKRGRFDLADGGTMFLDEVGDLSPATQIKLLRVLQDQEYERVGGTVTIRVNVRVVAASNKELEEEIRRGNFREDLYYRLNVVSIKVPPLRERPEDIPLLADHFFQIFRAQHMRPVKGITPKAMKALVSYNWPGNIRELKNCIESTVVICRREMIDIDDLPHHIREEGPADQLVFPLGTALSDVERQVILRTLAMTRGNKVKAARTLGIGLKTLYRRLEEYGSP